MTVHSLQNNEQTANAVPSDQKGPNAGDLSDPIGIGLRHPYYKEVIDHPPSVGWLEVHPENYFGGGAHRHFLSEARKNFELSLHGVGLSLGSAHPVSEKHLAQIKELADIYRPFSISDHASWSASGNAHLNDLLPLPYVQETLDQLCRNIDKTQEFLGRTILIENPSTYIAFAENDMEEFEFMNKAAHATGCGILLDVNNIYVQSYNHGLDPWDYIDGIDPGLPGEMHVAGHIEQTTEDGGKILVDTHSRPVKGEVWDLYEHAVRRFGRVPTLIEWDQDFPEFSVLEDEAEKARAIMTRVLAETQEAARAAE